LRIHGFPIEHAGQGAAGVRFLVPRHVLWAALGDDAAALLTAFGSKIDDPIRLFDNVKMMLDDDDGVAKVCQPLEHIEQLLHVIKVQARSRLVQDVEGAAALAPAQLARQLDPLRFSTVASF